MARILSTNAGVARPNRANQTLSTGIDKRPVESIAVSDPGPKRIVGGAGVSGVVGDFVGDGRHHGGSAQAVYAVAAEELAWWSGELGRELAPGAFGENLTLTGLDVDAALVGETWCVGDEVVLQVSGPRVPCSTFQVAMGEPGWVRRFSRRGRTGAYLSVVVPGTIRRGDAVEVWSRPEHGVTVPLLYRAVTTDPRWAEEALAARAYLEPELVDKLSRRATYVLADDP